MKTIKVVDSMGKNAKWSSKYLHVSFLISKSNSQYSFYFSFSIYFFFSYTIPIFCFPVLFTKLQVIISYVYYHTSGWGFSEWLILLSPYALPNSQYSFFLFVCFCFFQNVSRSKSSKCTQPPSGFPQLHTWRTPSCLAKSLSHFISWHFRCRAKERMNMGDKMLPGHTWQRFDLCLAKRVPRKHSSF